ncbi:hypothetical protein CVD19_17030 [Bacillus sp. T33-2]|nr:hypothetical protein CVD19_17030 [Bacillus sp. T33-2]
MLNDNKLKFYRMIQLGVQSGQSTEVKCCSVTIKKRQRMVFKDKAPQEREADRILNIYINQI